MLFDNYNLNPSSMLFRVVFGIIFAVFGYLLSSVPFSLIIPLKLCKVDIRLAGSHNVGATNVYRLCGIKIAIACFICDMLKGVVPIACVAYLGFNVKVQSIVAISSLLGHTFPIFLKFKGGKGVSTAFGSLLILSTELALIALAIWIVVFVLSRTVSSASIVAGASLAILTPTMPLYNVELLVAIVFIAMFVIVRHDTNLRRIMHKSEPRTF